MSIGIYVDSGYSDSGYVDGDTTSTIARPTSDISNTGWTPSTGSDLYAMLDEVSPDDADYISTSSLGAVCKFGMNATAFPGGASQQLSLRASSSTGNGLSVVIKDGATTIATRSLTLTPTFDLHTITLTGEGGLISSATGEALVTVSLGGELFASKAAAGEATLTIGADGTATAIGHLGGDATATVTATWTPYGIGWLEGTTEEAGLTPSGVANAVWAKVIEAGFSADQILRILAAHAAGSATGLEGANPQFTGLNGTTLRIDGAYNAGTRTIDALNGD